MTADSTEAAPPAIRPIVCAGDPYAIGCAQGEAARAQVELAVRIPERLEAFRALKPSLLPFAVFRWLATRRADAAWRTRVAPAVPAMDARMRGLAAGAGAHSGTLRLLNLLEPFMSDLRPLTDAPPPGGCSALAAATDAGPVVAHNFDYLPVVQPLYAVRDTRPQGGYRSLDFIVAPLVGAVDGVNEAGLCITNNYAYAIDAPGGGRTVTMAVSEALARCATVAEAADLLCGMPRWGGGLLMLADAGGDAASVELSNGRATVRRAEGGVLWHGNRFQTPSMREVELAPGARFTGRAPAPLRGTPVHRSSLGRERRIAELTAGAGRLSEAEVDRIMADHGPDGVPSDQSPCLHSDYWFTTATLRLYPRERAMRIAFSSACEARFVELTLGG